MKKIKKIEIFKKKIFLSQKPCAAPTPYCSGGACVGMYFFITILVTQLIFIVFYSIQI
jgi:hypothetical protein